MEEKVILDSSTMCAHDDWIRLDMRREGGHLVRAAYLAMLNDSIFLFSDQ